jgi:hypothetical protein
MLHFFKIRSGLIVGHVVIDVKKRSASNCHVWNTRFV